MENTNNCRRCWTLAFIIFLLSRNAWKSLVLGYICMSGSCLAGSAAVKRCSGIIHSVGQGEVRKKH